MASCYPCIRSLHGACRGVGCDCDHKPIPTTEVISYDPEEESNSTTVRERSNKPDAALKDQQSTGRKRAAKLYPLDREAPCEWLGKSGMGGGTKPISGCPVGDNCTQQARHHGPDKNTLNNEQGNVHRIGHLCHNRWHAANDPEYKPGMLVGD